VAISVSIWPPCLWGEVTIDKWGVGLLPGFTGWLYLLVSGLRGCGVR
jgi:hypothetical protein